MTNPWATIEKNPELPYHTIIVDIADARCIAQMSTYEPDDLFDLTIGAWLPNQIFAGRNEIRSYEIVRKTVQETLIGGRLHRTSLIEVRRGG